MQAVVCVNRLPGSAKQANKGSVDLATSVLQKGRLAISVSKRNTSVPRAFAAAEGRKTVPLPGRATAPSTPAVKGPVAGTNPARPFLLPLSLWGQGWPLLAAYTMDIQIQCCLCC